jgi:feruloyl esterase
MAMTNDRTCVASLVALIGLALAPRLCLAVDCNTDGLNGLNIAHLRAVSATSVPAVPPKQAYCDVKGSVSTEGEGAGPGSAGFEIMLPEHWNGKYMFSGVRGQGGTLASAASPTDLEQFMIKGYASVTSDQGHVSSDRKWYYATPGQGNMPQLVDYFYRAVHQVTVATKDLVRAYYQSGAITHSYFDGCSNGGREAMMEAARYPEDYDGVISGSTWLDPLGSALADLKNVKALINAPIPLSKLDEIDAAILAQCDAADGVKDGLIQNPAACSFKPERLVPKVLTRQQAQALNIYLSAVRDQKGDLVFPGTPVSDLKMQFGVPNSRMVELDEPPAAPTAAQPWGKGEFPHLWASATGVILTLGFRDPSVDMNNTVEGDGGVVSYDALATLYGRLRADMADDPASLKTYFGHGGKLILYHGLSDPIITPYSVVWFYEDLAAERGGYTAIQKDARLFLVPAMQHCSDGPTPTRFDTLTALEDWVEKGTPPDGIASTHMDGKTPDRSMPLCTFPEMAHYKGTGDVKDGQNWACRPSDRSMLRTGSNGAQAGLNSRNRHTTFVQGTPSTDLGN